MTEIEKVECLKINNEIIENMVEIKEGIKGFWYEIKEVNKFWDVREECTTLMCNVNVNSMRDKITKRWWFIDNKQ